MVRKALRLLLFILLLFLYLSYFQKQVQADSSSILIIGSPPEGVGDLIASKSGWKLVEFWHYSGGYWKATTETSEGFKTIIINDNEASNVKWTNQKFLLDKIYENDFVLEYKLWHPEEVLDAISNGSIITPVLNIDTGTINIDYEIDPINFFNFEELPLGMSSLLPEKPEYVIHEQYMIIRALPKLNCLKNSSLKKVLSFSYPHDIPIPQTSFGSLSYALYHSSGSYTGVGYSPDPFYVGQGALPIPFSGIKDIGGNLQSDMTITIGMYPSIINSPSDNLRIGYGTFANAGAVCIRFWYPIRIDYYALGPAPTVTPTPSPSPSPSPTPAAVITPPASENLSTKYQSSMDPKAVCIIRADNRGNEIFDVDQGIPVKEDVYANVHTREYLYNCAFTEHTHSESETIKVKKTYNLTWLEDHGYTDTHYCGAGIFVHGPGTYCTDSNGDGIKDSCPRHAYNGCRDTDGDGIYDYCPGHTVWVSNWVSRSATEVVYSNPHTVSRNYSYWTIDQFEVLVPERADINHAVLPGGSVSIPASGIPIPTIDLSADKDISRHVLNNPFSDAQSTGAIQYDTSAGCYVVNLGTSSIDGGYSRPSVPAISNYISIAENAIPEYRTRNDRLIFNGHTILNDSVSNTGNTVDPSNIPESGMCHQDSIYKKGLRIPDQVLNGTHSGSASIVYKRLSQSVNPVNSGTTAIPISQVNDVKVHTPVVCNSGILDDKNNDQMLNPDRSRSALVLGRPSRIRFLTTGEHLNIPGYNTSGTMDCRKYTKDRQVCFPFDVYIGTAEPVNSCFVPKNTWHSIPMGASFDEMEIYIPTWVPEGDYEVKFREIAVNTPNVGNIDYNLYSENLANKNIANYIAVRSSPVRVIGRIYGFRITDITDDLWRDVFRVNKESAVHSGNYYYVGTNDHEGRERGINQIFTLPILEGSHAVYKNRGALKTGYTFRFELETAGSYFGTDDHIIITPRFYYVKKDGTGRQEVDLWYHDEIDGKMNYFVKIEPGGRNRNNPIFMTLADDLRNVPDEEITDTARLLGINEKTFRSRKEAIGWFDRITLSQYQRTFIGYNAWLPQGVNPDTAAKSVQKWYGEYYLPNDLYVTAKGFDVPEYGRTHNGLDGKETFWFKDGYIIVNFEIKTVQNGDYANPVLSYWGAPYCNMFEREGFSYTKTDFNGAVFDLVDGDILFYYTDKRSSDDFRTGGTH